MTAHGGVESLDESGVTEASTLAAVEALRGAGAAGPDAVSVAIIEALARRAVAQRGQARRLLMQRVDQLLVGAEAVSREASHESGAPRREGLARTRGVLAGLSQLVERLGRSPASLPRAADRQPTPMRSRTEPGPAAALKSVTAHKGALSRMRAEQRLRQSLAQVPAMAGPLNSSHVMNRTLQALHELSPQYLDAFMMHIDTLLWLEQASGAGELAVRPTLAGTDAARKTGTRPVRKEPRARPTR